jgi:uncharacterized membrane protein YccC
MAVHQPGCTDIREHVGRALEEAPDLPQQLEEFVRQAHADFEMERRLDEDAAALDQRIAKRLADLGWTEWNSAELEFAR